MTTKFLVLTQLLTLASSLVFGANINESDWTYDGSKYSSGRILFTQGDSATLKNSNSYSTNGKLSISVEIPVEYFSIVKDVDKHFIFKIYTFGQDNYDYFSPSTDSSKGYSVTTGGIFMDFDAIKGNYNIDIPINKMYIPTEKPLDITFTMNSLNGLCDFSINSTSFPAINIEKTFTYKNIPATFDGFIIKFGMGYNVGTEYAKVTDFSYTPTIPEPTTYAAILGAMAFGVIAWRRRK